MDDHVARIGVKVVIWKPELKSTKYLECQNVRENNIKADLEDVRV
jgi:hypothetical protein